jgi:hypothetical protein
MWIVSLKVFKNSVTVPLKNVKKYLLFLLRLYAKSEVILQKMENIVIIEDYNNWFEVWTTMWRSSNVGKLLSIKCSNLVIYTFDDWRQKKNLNSKIPRRAPSNFSWYQPNVILTIHIYDINLFWSDRKMTTKVFCPQ